MAQKRDIQRPGKRSTGTWDKQAEKRDVPAKTGRVATLIYSPPSRFMDLRTLSSGSAGSWHTSLVHSSGR